MIILSKNIWIVREIDIEDVAYSDKYFKTREEAMEYLRQYKKSSQVVDLLIKVPLNYTESLVEELRESESNLIFTNYNATIVYRR